MKRITLGTLNWMSVVFEINWFEVTTVYNSKTHH